MTNTTEHEFKRPRDLACLFELSPGEPVEGLEGAWKLLRRRGGSAPAGGPLLQRCSTADDR